MNLRTHQSTQTLFVLLIAFIFTGVSLFLVLLGADAYQNSLQAITVNHQIRATLSYTANQIRTADRADNIEVTTVDGQQVLRIHSQEESKTGNTYLYFHKGFLMELFTSDEEPFVPEQGEKITEIKQFSISKNGRLFAISTTALNGKQISISVCPRAS